MAGAGHVYQKIWSLADKGYITELVHEDDDERPMREGDAGSRCF
jgi:hypothetical protein